jgi:hypothetical protein
VPFRIEQRLSEADLEQLLADYGAGMTGRQLAERYGLAAPLIELLKKRGVTVRHPRISEADKARAVDLYRQGGAADRYRAAARPEQERDLAPAQAGGTGLRSAIVRT